MIKKVAEVVELLKISDVAKALGISSGYVYELIDLGVIPKDDYEEYPRKKTTGYRLHPRVIDFLRKKQASGVPLKY